MCPIIHLMILIIWHHLFILHKLSLRTCQLDLAFALSQGFLFSAMHNSSVVRLLVGVLDMKCFDDLAGSPMDQSSDHHGRTLVRSY